MASEKKRPGLLMATEQGCVEGVEPQAPLSQAEMCHRRETQTSDSKMR